MPIVGEYAIRWAIDGYDRDRDVRLEFNMPVGRVFVKVSLTYIILDEDRTTAGIHIETIKRKRPDGLIEEIDVQSNHVYNDTMTNFKYFVFARKAIVTALVVIQWWG